MNAVIYCRVSSREQVEGTSLESQESACRAFAQREKHVVVRVFKGEGESAKFADRPELIELLDYCKKKAHGIDALIVWKLDRFARNVEDHFRLKATLRSYGVEILSATEPIQPDPNGQLMETILAGFAQFDNALRILRTKQGMQRRLEAGIFPWHPPLGYLPQKTDKKTEPDTPDPACFTHLQRAWRDFARGGKTKATILRDLRRAGVKGYRGAAITAHRLDQIFANPYYAGILRDPWSGAEHKGLHQPMVSVAEFARVTSLVKQRNRTLKHLRLHPDFPVRRIVRCPSCNCFLRSAFSRGATKRYGYYCCATPHCDRSRKSIPATAVHRELFQTLQELSVPAPLVRAVVREAVRQWTEDQESSLNRVAESRATMARLQKQLRELVVMRTTRLISDEEFLSTKAVLDRELLEVHGQEASSQVPVLDQKEIALLTRWIVDLPSLWRALPIDQQYAFVLLLVGDGYTFQKSRTTISSHLFRATESFRGYESRVVPPKIPNPNALFAEIRALLTILPDASAQYKSDSLSGADGSSTQAVRTDASNLKQPLQNDRSDNTIRAG